MELLTNASEISDRLNVSIFRKDFDMEKYIREAQLFDLKPLVCDDFFQDLTSGNPMRDYDLLLYGGNYTFQERNYYFEGLKAVIAYFAYARYVFTSHQTDTPFGIKEKNYHDGTPLTQAERRDMRTIYLQNADILWKDCVKYIERNIKNFPEWENCSENCEKTPKNSKNFRMKLL